MSALRRRAHGRPAVTACECGDALPVVPARLASMRRRWIARIGWYPGDWVWVSLATLVVAAAGAAVAIAVSEHRQSSHPAFEAVGAPSPCASRQRRFRPATTPTTKPDTSHLPTAPEPGAGARERPDGLARERDRLDDRPRLVSEDLRPSSGARDGDEGGQEGAQPGRRRRLEPLREPPARVLRRLHRHLPARRPDADAAVGTARQAGFPGAYSREIAR